MSLDQLEKLFAEGERRYKALLAQSGYSSLQDLLQKHPEAQPVVDQMRIKNFDDTEILVFLLRPIDNANRPLDLVAQGNLTRALDLAAIHFEQIST